MNIVLNKLKVNEGLSCHLCGRSYPETILNIEAKIHHNAKHYVCIGTKACNKAKKKKK